MEYEIIILILLSFLTGVSVKYADQLEDRKKKGPIYLRVLFGLIYGFLIFYTIYRYNEIAPLWLGTVFAMVIYGKIDSLAHYIGVIFLFGLLIVTRFFDTSVILLVIFILANLFEEYAQRIKWRKLKKIMSYRPILEIATLIVSIVTGLWTMLIALIFFDIGYILVGKVMK